MSKFILLFGLALASSLPSIGNATVYEVYKDSECSDLIGEIKIIQEINGEQNWYQIKEINLDAGPKSAADLLEKALGIHLGEDPDSNSGNYIFISHENLTLSPKLSIKLKIILSDINSNSYPSKKLFIEFQKFEKSGSFFSFHSFYLIKNVPEYLPKS